MKIADSPYRFFSCLNFLFITFLLLASQQVLIAQQTVLSQNGIAIIPYPKEARLSGADFVLDNSITIIPDKNASPNDKFAAGQLYTYLTTALGLKCNIGQQSPGKSIVLTRKGANTKYGDEGYFLQANENSLVVKAQGEAGLFYGVQTIMQLVQSQGAKAFIKGIEISDWPDTKIRAAHYDTKHHQDTRAFVESFIQDLSKYKINMLIWEWEDKFAYPSHPEIGAPGAFTMKEMQEITQYAHQYHIQIVPLVQGLGHVSFILKWPQFANLRELPASNFEFCPLKEGTYQLLSDLWKDAVAATPGSKYIHIGSDETYELGACPECKLKQAEIGRSGLYHLFVSKSADQLKNTGREVMAWESPMGWAKGRLQVYHQGQEAKEEKSVTPRQGLVLTESYDYETPDLKYAKQARALGHPVFAYDPNPGIEQLFLPYFFSKNDNGDKQTGSLENSYNFLQSTMGKGVFDGVIKTSWDDAGLPMQVWMLSFATTAAFSWNAAAPGLPEFTSTFFKNRYGNDATQIDTLYKLLNEGAYFYMESFERKVWAWGEIGKTHLPDLPRGDALEYDPFWNTEYADRIKAANEFLEKMNRSIAICQKNLDINISNRYDIEVFLTLARLIKQTASTYLTLSQLEKTIKQAHEQRFVNLQAAYQILEKAEQIVKDNLSEREKVFNDLVKVWEKTRLKKGMSTPGKAYFFEQDRTRHFANRVPGMEYLIVDEQKLNLEDYLSKLQFYMKNFRSRFLNPTGKN
jgi:hexosaminidase